jgi:hypothetical protein
MITHFDIILPDAPGYPVTEFTLYYCQDDDWVWHALLAVDAGVEQFVTSFTSPVCGEDNKSDLMNKAHFHAMKFVRENLDLTVKPS